MECNAKNHDEHIFRPDIPEPKIYRLNETNTQTKDDLEESVTKDSSALDLVLDDTESNCSCGGATRETSAFPKAFEKELLVEDPVLTDAQKKVGRALYLILGGPVFESWWRH